MRPEESQVEDGRSKLDQKHTCKIDGKACMFGRDFESMHVLCILHFFVHFFGIPFQRILFRGNSWISWPLGTLGPQWL